MVDGHKDLDAFSRLKASVESLLELADGCDPLVAAHLAGALDRIEAICAARVNQERFERLRTLRGYRRRVGGPAR